MAIRDDYLLEMVARFVEALVEGVGRQREGRGEEALGSYEGVVGGVLDMDAGVALSLAPSSLVTMLQLSSVDERLAQLAAWAMGAAADVYEDEGSPLADVRRRQARAVAEAYGFEEGSVPPELSRRLEEEAGGAGGAAGGAPGGLRRN